ncbi:hypothetical protein FDECE_14000 [Fusarium decemcellulare]|nr:hypothetical protein FDECE_14000 [Fusarium decemcellulare]
MKHPNRFGEPQAVYGTCFALPEKDRRGSGTGSGQQPPVDDDRPTSDPGPGRNHPLAVPALTHGADADSDGDGEGNK